jgi:hypothetical protein
MVLAVALFSVPDTGFFHLGCWCFISESYWKTQDTSSSYFIFWLLEDRILYNSPTKGTEKVYFLSPQNKVSPNSGHKTAYSFSHVIQH